MNTVIINVWGRLKGFNIEINLYLTNPLQVDNTLLNDFDVE